MSGYFYRVDTAYGGGPPPVTVHHELAKHRIVAKDEPSAILLVNKLNGGDGLTLYDKAALVVLQALVAQGGNLHHATVAETSWAIAAQFVRHRPTP